MCRRLMCLLFAVLASASPARADITLSGVILGFNDRLGASVATAGDVNGDGFSDLIFGAPGWDAPGRVDAGKFSLEYGASPPQHSGPFPEVVGSQVSGRFGAAVACAGDVNGDGYADVLVGAPDEEHGALVDAGRVHLFLGGPGGLSLTAALVLGGTAAQDSFGAAVASAGDVDGDGFDDVLVGAPRRDTGAFTDNGQALLFRGSAAGLIATPAWTREGGNSNALLGTAVSGAGDVNGDGFADVIVGAPRENAGVLTDVGAAHVFLGSAAGLTASAWVSQAGSATSSRFGTSVAGAGDVNGDGYADWLVGQPATVSLQRSVIVCMSSSTGLADTTRIRPFPDRATFGTWVASAGDVNDDGYADIVYSCPAGQNSPSGQSYAQVRLGSPSGVLPDTYRELTASNAPPDGLAGTSVSGAGDFNGDGFGDLVIGAPGQASGSASRVVMYTGGDDLPATHAGWYRESAGLSAPGRREARGAGDVNGDGFDDVLFVEVLASESLPGVDAEISLVLGSAAGLETTSTSHLTIPPRPVVYMGATYIQPVYPDVRPLGDVNGDGFDDVGIAIYDSSTVAASVYLGSSTGLASTPAWSVAPVLFFRDLSLSYITGPGDVDADGFADVLVTSRGMDSTKVMVRLFRGGAAGPASTPLWQYEYGDSILGAANYGIRSQACGDLDRDGHADFGLHIWPHLAATGERVGRVLVFRGSVSGSTPTPWQVLTGTPTAPIGIGLASVGDSDGDGYDDLVYLVPYTTPAIITFYGGPDSLVRVVQPQPAGVNMQSVTALGDMDRDGSPEFLASVTPPGSATRSVSILSASASRTWSVVWTVSDSLPPGAQSCFRSLTSSGIGDVNGDGRPEVLVHSDAIAFADTADCSTSRTRIYYGGPFPGRLRRVRQDVDGGDSPNRSRVAGGTSVQLLADALSGQGRGRIRMRAEVKLANTPFDGLGLLSSPWLDSGAPGAGGSVSPLVQTLSGLQPGEGYHWRVRFEGHSPYFGRSAWYTLSSLPETGGTTGGSFVVADPNVGTPVRTQIGSLAFAPPRPNPSRDHVLLSFTLPSAGEVALDLHDVAGRRVRRLASGPRTAGLHALSWDGRDESGHLSRPGLYYARLVVGGVTLSRTLVRLD